MTMDLHQGPRSRKTGYLEMSTTVPHPVPNRKAVMSVHSTLLTACLLGLSLLIVPPDVTGQAPASDSTGQTISDSQPALTDTAGKTDAAGKTDSAQGTSDSVVKPAGRDSVPAADSTRAAPDTVTPKSQGSATATDTAAVRVEPGDSTLNAACRGPAGPATVARDLLVIVFAPEAGTSERDAAVKSVDGTLLGPVSSSEPGAYYLRVPSGGEEYRLRVAADQLIQLAQVRQVGSRACPPPPPPAKARQ